MNSVITVTKREKEVLQLVALEYSSREIAERLFVCHQTVISHRKNLKRKLLVKNSAGLVRVGFQQGLLVL